MCIVVLGNDRPWWGSQKYRCGIGTTSWHTFLYYLLPCWDSWKPCFQWLFMFTEQKRYDYGTLFCLISQYCSVCKSSGKNLILSEESFSVPIWSQIFFKLLSQQRLQPSLTKVSLVLDLGGSGQLLDQQHVTAYFNYFAWTFQMSGQIISLKMCSVQKTIVSNSPKGTITPDRKSDGLCTVFKMPGYKSV